MNRNREMMMRELQELDLRQYDLRLFLDTHPFEEKAVVEYNLTSNKYLSMRKHFEKLYGPLTIGDKEDAKSPWEWVEGPWPWQNPEDMKEDKINVGI